LCSGKSSVEKRSDFMGTGSMGMTRTYLKIA
jgi:hypothetical protein